MTGIIDFAQGDKVVLGGLIGLSLVGPRLSNLAALLVVILMVGLVLGVVYDWVVIVPTHRNGVIAAVAATVGHEPRPRQRSHADLGAGRPAVPAGGAGRVDLGGLRISYQDLVIWGVLVLVGVGLAFLMDRTRVGRGMVAAATDPLAATTVGINVRRTRAISFALAFGLAAIAGVLVAPITLAGGGTPRRLTHAEGIHRRGAWAGWRAPRACSSEPCSSAWWRARSRRSCRAATSTRSSSAILIVVLLVVPNGIFGLRRRLA